MIDGSRIKRVTSFSGFLKRVAHERYSLGRKILFEKMRLKPAATIKGLKHSLGEELLRVAQELSTAARQVPRDDSRFAHITVVG